MGSMQKRNEIKTRKTFAYDTREKYQYRFQLFEQYFFCTKPIYPNENASGNFFTSNFVINEEEYFSAV